MPSKKPQKGQKKITTKKPARTLKKAVASARPSQPKRATKKTGAKQKALKAVKAATATKSGKKVASVKRVLPVKKIKPLKGVKPASHVHAKPAQENKQRLSPRERLLLEIRKRLIEQKLELLSEAEEALNVLPGQTVFPDLGDQASAEIDRNFMLRLRGREQRLLKKIEEAIEKIENGSFGVCDVCGEQIDVKRLEARPVTTMCIACKTEQEEEEKNRGF